VPEVTCAGIGNRKTPISFLIPDGRFVASRRLLVINPFESRSAVQGTLAEVRADEYFHAYDAVLMSLGRWLRAQTLGRDWVRDVATERILTSKGALNSLTA